MSFHGIVFYVTRALRLAVPASLLLYGLRRLRKREIPAGWKRESAVFLFYLYFFSLIAITVIRGGAHLKDWWTLPHTPETVQLIPILVTLRQGRAGAWYLIYPIAGNILWFLPFGAFWAALRPGHRWWQAALGSLGLSVAIEIVQWLLLSGVSDIDDVIFNVLGGILGFGLTRLWQNQHRR